MKRFAILTVLVLLAPALASAAFFEKVGTFSAQFMMIGTTARAAGMGAAYTAVADDASSAFWNPAGLVNVRGSEFLLSHAVWPADIKLTSAVLTFAPRQIPGTFAISARSFWMDPMLVRTAFQPEGNGQTFDAGSTAFGFSYSRFFTDKFSSGFTLNYMHMGLAEAAVNSASFDFGVLYRIGVRGLKLGMVIQNLGGKVNFDQREAKLPTTFKVGISFNALNLGDQQLLASAEFQHPADAAERANVGVEYSMRNMFYGRVGYNLNYDSDALAFGFGVSFGTGKTSRARFDYAATDMRSLGWVNRLTLAFAY
jgi:hypothetical protein